MKRGAFIEQCLIQAYGQLPTDDAEINIEMINNSWLGEAIAVAAKTCYTEAIQIDGIGYVNNGFYTTFAGLVIVADDTDNLCYKLTLPEIPPGIGHSSGISAVRFKDDNGFVSQSAIPLSINQQAYADRMRTIPNKILYWQEGNTLRMKSTLPMWSYTAVIKMISGGDANDLNSELNIPPDYEPIVEKIIMEALMKMKAIPKDTASDGLDMQ